MVKAGDVAWVHLTAAVCWLLGAILFWCLGTIGSCSSAEDDGEKRKSSRVKYEQNMFWAMSCEDEARHRSHENTDNGHSREDLHRKMCDEMRRVAEAAVAKYHPREPEKRAGE